MSSLKQEVAAILMDYTDKIPEQVYMNILNRLGQIPDHKDPRKAAEIQKDLDEANQNVSMLEDERELLIEEVHNEKQLRKEWQSYGLVPEGRPMYFFTSMSHPSQECLRKCDVIAPPSSPSLQTHTYKFTPAPLSSPLSSMPFLPLLLLLCF